ncbi:uncharacterized protein LOC128125955 [Lactuca sativa]|uniref:uncharacterized protein LOC128125955 n=1 Tax=Lactuca sativa TaxID=4236 RepID=UPI0022B02671|nr:uncharacterized protein LOC128125955 [Lactuca sativa]
MTKSTIKKLIGLPIHQSEEKKHSTVKDSKNGSSENDKDMSKALVVVENKEEGDAYNDKIHAKVPTRKRKQIAIKKSGKKIQETRRRTRKRKTSTKQEDSTEKYNTKDEIEAKLRKKIGRKKKIKEDGDIIEDEIEAKPTKKRGRKKKIKEDVDSTEDEIEAKPTKKRRRKKKIKEDFESKEDEIEGKKRGRKKKDKQDDDNDDENFPPLRTKVTTKALYTTVKSLSREQKECLERLGFKAISETSLDTILSVLAHFVVERYKPTSVALI